MESQSALQDYGRYMKMFSSSVELLDAVVARSRRASLLVVTSLRPPDKDVDIKVDFVYGREEALKVIAASQADYQNEFGHLHTNGSAT